MAATIDIEIESGVFTGPIRSHQGYYAGDFSLRPLKGRSGGREAGATRSIDAAAMSVAIAPHAA